MKGISCYTNALFTEKKLYELHNLHNENKGIICGGLMGGDIFINLVAEIFI